MILFYCPDIKGHEAILSPEESSHCIRVLRLSKGEKVRVIDGKGGYFNAIIAAPDPKNCRLEIVESIVAENIRNYNIHVAIAPTKNMDRFEWFVEKAVEIGIDTITPLLCEHSERKVLKTDRLHKLIISTMKQAIIPLSPVLHEMTPLKAFLGKTSVPETQLFIAHCLENVKKKDLADATVPGRNALILIGPEGDFSMNEIMHAENKGFIPVSLGNNRLRTETAGIVACHTVNLLNRAS